MLEKTCMMRSIMKTRYGFVSNSSSSSFVCCLSGEVFEVCDNRFRDFGLVSCKHGHVFKEEFALPDERKLPDRDEMIETLQERIDSKRECAEIEFLDDEELQERYQEDVLDSEDRHFIDEAHCPICTMNRIPDSELLNYLLKKSKSNREKLAQEIRLIFNSNHDRFLDFILNK